MINKLKDIGTRLANCRITALDCGTDCNGRVNLIRFGLDDGTAFTLRSETEIEAGPDIYTSNVSIKWAEDER